MVHTSGTGVCQGRRRLEPATRARLFEAAGAIFAENGFERASLNAILAKAGMGKSSFFYYFLDKEDLFAALIEDVVGRLVDRVGPTTLPDDADGVWNAAAGLIMRLGRAADAEPGFLGLLRALQPLRRTAGLRLQHAMDSARGAFEPLLTRGIELGAVRSDLDPQTLMAIIEAVDLALDDAFHRIADPDASAIEAHRRRLIDTIHRLIRP